MEYIFFLFGGDPSLQRAERLLELWKDESDSKGFFFVTGYPNKKEGELVKLKKFLIENGVPRDHICVHGSYETLSNVEGLIDYLQKSKEPYRIYASTEILHWIRFYLIFIHLIIFYWRIPFGIKRSLFKIRYKKSKERRGILYICMAIVLILLYIFPTPTVWQLITRLLRRNEYRLCKKHVAVIWIAEEDGVNVIGFLKGINSTFSILWMWVLLTKSFFVIIDI